MKELENIVLNIDIPEHHLKKGDIGTIVFQCENKNTYEIEFSTFSGNSIAVLTLSDNDIRPIQNAELPHVRLYHS